MRIHKCSIMCCCPVHRKGYMQFEPTTRLHYCRRPNCFFGMGATMEQISAYWPGVWKSRWEGSRAREEVRIHLYDKMRFVLEVLLNCNGCGHGAEKHTGGSCSEEIEERPIEGGQPRRVTCGCRRLQLA